MRKAVLIGFQYDKEKRLPGIATDLYQVYSFLKKHNWKDDEITILTDIREDDPTDVLKIAILEKIVDPGVLSFIEDIKDRKQYIQFSTHKHYNNFSSVFGKYQFQFIYYTGHSKNGNIILPNYNYLSLLSFRDLMISDKIVCILDCCESNLELPFVLMDNLYRCKNDLNFIKSELLCISSSLEDEKSITSKSGSFFTRYLFNILEDSSLSLVDILKKIKKKLSSIKQTANISTSYPNVYSVPGFVYSFPNISLEIYPKCILLTK